MLNLLSSDNGKTIEVNPKNVQIIVEEESNLSVSISIPSAEKLMESHCVPAPTLSLSEVCSLDPFNFNDIIDTELSNLKNKYERFKDSPTFISKFAGLSILKGDLDAAEDILSSGLKETTSSHLMQSLGNVHVLKGEHDKAIGIFSKRELTNDVFSNLRLAFIDVKSNNFMSAERHLDKALEIDPLDFRTRMFSGALHLNNGECEKAIRDFRVACGDNNDSSALHVNLAAAHWSLGHHDKAIKELNNALTINPLNENALIFYCDAMFSLDDYKGSIEKLEFFIKFDEKSEFIWERLARSYYFSKDYIKAKLALEKQISLRDDPSAWNNLGLVHWKLRDGKKAISYLYHSLEKSKNSTVKASYPILNLAGILNEAKKSEECLKFLNSLSNFNSEQISEDIRTKIAVQRFIALEATQNHALISQEICEVISKHTYEREENLIILYIYKIYCNTVIERSYEKTIKSINEILEILDGGKRRISKENKKMVYNNICFSLLYFNETKEAEKYISKISSHVHKDPFCTATLGLFKVKKGEIDSGKELYNEAISLAKKRDLKDKIRQRMQLELGKQLLNTNHVQQAKKLFNKSLKEKQGHSFAHEEARLLLKAIT